MVMRREGSHSTRSASAPGARRPLPGSPNSSAGPAASRRARRAIAVSGGERAPGLPDVPTLEEAGVDVELRLELWHYVQRINAEGTTILLTTHYLEEAEQLCDQIAFINDGSIVAQGTTAELSEQFGVSSLEDAYLELVGRKELSRAGASLGDVA